MTAEGPIEVLGPGRCKRFAMHVVDGVIKAVNVSEFPDDPVSWFKRNTARLESRIIFLMVLFASLLILILDERLEIATLLLPWQMESLQP